MFIYFEQLSSQQRLSPALAPKAIPLTKMGLSPILLSVKAPYWDLENVKAVAALPNGLLVRVTRAADFFPDRQSAIAACRSAIAALTVRDFAETQRLAWDIADVYGVRMADNTGWYLKITVDEDEPEVVVISFHPLEYPLKTNGEVVKP